ncbi:hypothetical protein NUITMVR1_11060 [Raoultella ornithinolytica]|nr:hypothetical protein NUITMVR1_11060 [Raoultella ornithinolytica]
MQLLSVEAMLAHHFIDELLRRRVVSEIASHLHHIVLRLQQKTTASRRLGFCGGFRFAATGSEENTQGK